MVLHEPAARALGDVEGRADGVHLAVIIEEEIGIDTAHLHPDGIGPRAGRICGRHEEIASPPDVGIDDIERPVVVPEGARENVHTLRQLIGPVDGVTDLLPVDQVSAVEHRDAREVFERTGHKVILLPHPNHARIGIETGDHGVAVRHLGVRVDPCLERVGRHTLSKEQRIRHPSGGDHDRVAEGSQRKSQQSNQYLLHRMRPLVPDLVHRHEIPGGDCAFPSPGNLDSGDLNRLGAGPSLPPARSSVYGIQESP